MIPSYEESQEMADEIAIHLIQLIKYIKSLL